MISIGISEWWMNKTRDWVTSFPGKEVPCGSESSHPIGCQGYLLFPALPSYSRRLKALIWLATEVTCTISIPAIVFQDSKWKLSTNWLLRLLALFPALPLYSREGSESSHLIGCQGYFYFFSYDKAGDSASSHLTGCQGYLHCPKPCYRIPRLEVESLIRLAGCRDYLVAVRNAGRDLTINH